MRRCGICCVDLTVEQGAAHKISEPLKPKIYRSQILSSLELYRIGKNYHLM